MARIWQDKHEVFTFVYHPDIDDEAYNTLRFATFIVDPINWSMSIFSDVDNYMAAWKMDGGCNFLEFLIDMSDVRLLSDLSRGIVFDGPKTLKNLKAALLNIDSVEGTANFVDFDMDILQDVCHSNDGKDSVEAFNAITSALQGTNYEVNSASRNTYILSAVSSRYREDEELIVNVFCNAIKPRIREILKNWR